MNVVSAVNHKRNVVYECRNGTLFWVRHYRVSKVKYYDFSNYQYRVNGVGYTKCTPEFEEEINKLYMWYKLNNES